MKKIKNKEKKKKKVNIWDWPQWLDFKISRTIYHICNFQNNQDNYRSESTLQENKGFKGLEHLS